MSLALVLALALARPVEVSEHWEIVGRGPLREAVSVWADYRRLEGPQALLPPAVQGDAAPLVTAVGHREALVVRRGPQGWEATLPAGSRSTVRVLSQLVRTDLRARLFRLPWPPIEPTAVPTRRVVVAPRAWIAEQPAEWTCPEGYLDVTTCVSSARTPLPLVLRIRAPAAGLAWLVLAALLVATLAAGTTALAPRGPARRLRAVCAVAGALAGLALALGVVGAGALGWPVALAGLGGLGALAGALAARRAASVRAGAVLLVALPLVVVFDGRLRDVLASAALALAAVVVGALAPSRAPVPAAPAPPAATPSDAR